MVFGQERVVELALAAVLSGGHGLLVGAPGLAKTRLVHADGAMCWLDLGACSLHPDLMPADILGSEVLGSRRRRAAALPLRARADLRQHACWPTKSTAPRRETQSALLQAMQEHHVTVGGRTYDVPQPFLVLATQNPIEQEGTYPLPEAQLDRFLLQVDVPYPDAEIERKILIETTGLRRTAAASGAECASADVVAASRCAQCPSARRCWRLFWNWCARRGRARATTARQPARAPGAPVRALVKRLMLAVRAARCCAGAWRRRWTMWPRSARPALVHRMQLSFGARAEGLDIDTLVDDLAERAA